MKNVLSVTLVACLWLLVSPTAQAIIDVNDNGISDLWEKVHNNGNLLPGNFDPQADPDGDGWTNAQEAAAGTDPSNANPPTGYLQPEITYYPAVYYTDPETNITATQSPATVTLNWPTLPGKQYTLHYSTDLAPGNWSPLDEPRIGTGWDMGHGITLTQPDGSIADRIFWRVAVTDPVPAIDTDSDWLGDYEEYLAGTDPVITDSDTDNLSDYAELIAGTNPNHADEDGDGITDPLELAAGTNSKNQDTDGDAIPDWLDSQPLLSAQLFADADDDGIPDANDPDPNNPRGPKPFIISENASGNPNCELEMDESSSFILTVSNPAGPVPTASDFKLYLNGTEETADITALTAPPSAIGTQRFNFSWLAKVTTSYPAQTLQNISLRFRDSQNATTWLNVARADVAEWEGMIAGVSCDGLNSNNFPIVDVVSHYKGVKQRAQRFVYGKSIWYRGPKAIPLLDASGSNTGTTAQIGAQRYPLFLISKSGSVYAVEQTLDISNPIAYPHHGRFYINRTAAAITMSPFTVGSIQIPGRATDQSPGIRFQPFPPAPETGASNIGVTGSSFINGEESTIYSGVWELLNPSGNARNFSSLEFTSVNHGNGTIEVVTDGTGGLSAGIGATITPHASGTLEHPGIPISLPQFPPAPYDKYAGPVPLLPIQSEQWHKLVLKVGPDAGAVSNGITLKLGTGEEGENDPQTGFTLQTPGTGGFEPLTLPATGKIEMAPNSALYQKLTSLEGLTLFLKRDSTVNQFHRLGLDLIPKRSTYLVQRVAALDVRSIDFVNKDKALVVGLKVGKMENSLSAAGALDIQLDKDRFYVRLPGAASLRNVSIKLATTGNPVATYNDDPTEIALEVDGNDLITKSLLLVSDDVDDLDDGSGVKVDNKKDDRTHKVQLGGKVRVESIRIDGTDYPVDSKIPVPARKKLSGRIILVGAASAKALEVAQLRDIARERYAQSGVIFDLTVTTMDVPEGVVQGAVNHDGGGGSGPEGAFSYMHEDMRKLVDKANQEGIRGDVTVFVVPDLFEGHLGRAYTKRFTGPDDQARANTVVISATKVLDGQSIFQFTIAHEVGHLLTNHFHFGEEYANGEPEHKIDHNLMRNGTSPNHKITSSKRLYGLQEDMFLNELLKNP